MKGMKFYHQKNIAHRDIKPENILVDMSCPNLTTKIIDFGFAAQSTKKMDVFCGTPAYMSPEICAKEKYFGAATDMWASGILLYTMLFGAQPFRATNEKDLFRKIVKGIYHTPSLTSGGRSTVRASPLRSPRQISAQTRGVNENDRGVRFQDFRDIKNAQNIRELLADILTTDEAKRISAGQVLAKYDNWFNL